MEFIQKNARAIVLALLIVGVVSVVSSNNDDGSNGDEVANGTETSQTTSEGPVAPETDADQTDETDVESTQPAPIEQSDDSFSVDVVSGDNQTKLVRRIVDTYLDNADTELSAEQKLYVETNLVNTLPRNDLIFVGDTIEVSNEDVESFVSSAQDLSESQIAAWAKYL